jgi:hypothetical protein
MADCHQQGAPAISNAQTACAALKDSPFVPQALRVVLNAAMGSALAAVPAPFHAGEQRSSLAGDDVARSAPTQRSLVLRL